MSKPVMEGFSAASRRSLEGQRGGVSLVVDGWDEGPIELVGGGSTWWDAWWAALKVLWEGGFGLAASLSPSSRLGGRLTN